jgi:hypothetical protein
MVHQVEERLSYIQQGGDCGTVDSQQIEVASSSVVETLANDEGRRRSNRIIRPSVHSQADCKCRSSFSLRQRQSDDLIGYTSEIVGLESFNQR